MLTSNRDLLDNEIGARTRTRFLKLLSERGVNESALRFLAEVSAADGEAVEGNQTEISKRLLVISMLQNQVLSQENLQL